MPGGMMPGMLPGMVNQPGMMPGQAGQVPQDPLQQQPFMPANHQNALAAGTLTSERPLQLMDNSSGFQSTTFGNSSIGMANSTMMTNMSGSQGYPPGMSPNQMPMQTTNINVTNSMQGSMGMSGANMGVSSQKMDQMMMQMSQMQDMMTDQRNYIEQRDAWLETRMSQLDRRCQKVEVLSDRLYTMLRSFDINDLAAVPRDVTKALNMFSERLEEGGFSEPGSPKSPSSPKALRDASQAFDAPPLPPPAAVPALADASNGHASGHHHGMGHGTHGIEAHIKKIEQMMGTLISHAEATPQITRMLWRMDLNLRQLSGTATNLPQQAVVPVQDAPASSAYAGQASKPGDARNQATWNAKKGSRSSSKTRGGPGGSGGGNGTV